jgi:hypothetical protein
MPSKRSASHPALHSGRKLASTPSAGLTQWRGLPAAHYHLPSEVISPAHVPSTRTRPSLQRCSFVRPWPCQCTLFPHPLRFGHSLDHRSQCGSHCSLAQPPHHCLCPWTRSLPALPGFAATETSNKAAQTHAATPTASVHGCLYSPATRPCKHTLQAYLASIPCKHTLQAYPASTPG